MLECAKELEMSGDYKMLEVIDYIATERGGIAPLLVMWAITSGLHQLEHYCGVKAAKVAGESLKTYSLSSCST
jgi:hypothetical protein